MKSRSSVAKKIARGAGGDSRLSLPEQTAPFRRRWGYDERAIGKHTLDATRRLMNEDFLLMLVCDTPESAQWLNRQIAESDPSGFHFSVYSDLSTGIDALRTRTVDCVVLYLVKPEREVCPAIEAVRNVAPLSAIVVIDDEAESEMQAVEAVHSGAQEFVVRNEVQPALLRKLVRLAIERRRTRIALERALRELSQRAQRADKELRASEERCGLLLQGISDHAILFLSPSGIITSWHAGAQAVFQFEGGEIVGEHFSKLFVNVAKCPPDEWMAVAERNGRVEIDDFGIRRDRSQFRSESTLSVVRDTAEQVIGFALITQDVSAQHAEHQQVLQAERYRAIGEMISGIAHESRNALQRMQASVNCLRRRLKEMPETVAMLDEVERAGDGLWRLLDAVRDYSAPLQLTREKTLLRDVWRAAWTSLDRPLERRQLIESIDCAECAISADRSKLEQAFRSIFDRALEGAAGVVSVRIGCRKHHHDIVVSVADDGRAMTKEQVDSLFHPFFDTKKQGIGVGLAVAKRIIEAHGGTIKIGSQSDRGTELVLTFSRIEE